jgi:lipopolysaccharide export system permease protein
MLSLQYIALALAVGFGLIVIHRGIILEPPAFIDRIATALTTAFTQRFART